jgi:hypothetical protein
VIQAVFPIAVFRISEEAIDIRTGERGSIRKGLVYNMELGVFGVYVFLAVLRGYAGR